MWGLVRFRMLRAGNSKYWTSRFASNNSLCDAMRARPTSAMFYFRFLFALLQGQFWGGARAPACRVDTYVDASYVRAAKSVRHQPDLQLGVTPLPQLRAGGPV